MDDTPAPQRMRDAWLALGVGVPLLAVANAVRKVDGTIGIAAFALGAIAIGFGVWRLFNARARARR